MQSKDGWASAAQIFARTPLIGDQAAQYTALLSPLDAKKTDPSSLHIGIINTIVMAPSRAGKGVSLTVPALLTWTGSAFIIDTNGEYEALTRYARSMQGDRIVRLSLDEPDNSAQINPFEHARWESSYEMSDLEEIATLLLCEDGVPRNHFEKRASEILAAMAAHHYHSTHSAPPPSLLAHTLGVRDVTPVAYVRELIAGWIESARGADNLPAYLHVLSQFLESTHQEFVSILNTLLSGLKVFFNPLVARLTQRSTFAPEDLQNGKTTLYLRAKWYDSDHLRPLYRCLMTVILRRLTRELARDAYGRPVRAPYPLLLMLDEMHCIMGKVPYFEKVYTLLPTFGIAALLVVHDVEMLEHMTSKRSNLLAKTPVVIGFGMRSFKTADWFSKALGSRTVKQKTITYDSVGGKGLFGNKKIISESYVQVPLLSTHDLHNLPSDRAIVMVQGMLPMFVKRHFYYNVPGILGLIGPPSAAQTA